MHTRCRIYAFEGKTKSSATRDILGNDIDSYKKRINFQMAADIKSDNIESDHVKPICLL